MASNDAMGRVAATHYPTQRCWRDNIKMEMRESVRKFIGTGVSW